MEFLQRVRKLCSEYDVLLIADEVLTGFGRCGKMFACELAGVVPDLMCLSKGITGGVLPHGRDGLHGRDSSRPSSAAIAAARFTMAIPTPGIPLPPRPRSPA